MGKDGHLCTPFTDVERLGVKVPDIASHSVWMNSSTLLIYSTTNGSRTVSSTN